MAKKLPTIIFCALVCIGCTSTSIDLPRGPLCPNTFQEPQICSITEGKAQKPKKEPKAAKTFFKLVFKTVVKSFIKSSVNSFIKAMLKELLSSISNDFIRSIIQTLIKLMANVASNLLTYAFTQYLIKLIIKKITKTAKKIVRITLFKGLLKKGVKYVASTFGKPFIVKVNEKTKIIIKNNAVVKKSQAIVKKMDHFKGLNKLKKSKLVKKYKKFIEKAWNRGKPLLQIKPLFNNNQARETSSPSIVEFGQQLTDQQIQYTILNNNKNFTEISLELPENKVQSMTGWDIDCDSVDSFGDLGSGLDLTGIAARVLDIKGAGLAKLQGKWIEFLLAASGLYKFVAALIMVGAFGYGTRSSA